MSVLCHRTIQQYISHSSLRSIFSPCLVVVPRNHRSMASTGVDMLEKAKQTAAHMAVDNHVQSNFNVGIGSGSTVVYAVERLGDLIKSGKLQNIKCVPSSFQSLQLIRKHKLILTDLQETPLLDVAIDGADEVDSNLNCIKGGGGCLTQEKIVVAAAKKFVVIADSRKNSTDLGIQWKKGIPIEVIPMGYLPVLQKVEKLLEHRPILRAAVNKAGPVVTDNGNFILDCPFSAESKFNWATTAIKLKMIPGVVETGLFVNTAFKAYFGYPDGRVEVQDSPASR